MSLGGIDSDGVIDNEVDWNKGVDFVGIASELGHSVSHGSEIDDSGHSTIFS